MRSLPALTAAVVLAAYQVWHQVDLAALLGVIGGGALAAVLGELLVPQIVAEEASYGSASPAAVASDPPGLQAAVLAWRRPLAVLLAAVSLLAGGAAGWWVGRAGATPEQTIVAGLVAGLIMALLVASGLAVLGYRLGRDRVIQELVRRSEPHPEDRLPSDAIAPIGAAVGIATALALAGSS